MSKMDVLMSGISERSTIKLKADSKRNGIAMMKVLAKESGNGKYSFAVGACVMDIVSETKPKVVTIIDRFIQNGWPFYEVADSKRKYTLRERDLR